MGGSGSHLRLLAVVAVISLASAGARAGATTRPAPVAILVQELPEAIARAEIRLFGVSDPEGILAYFREHRIAVTRVHERGELTEGRLPVWLGYASQNAGGDGGGSTVTFPHQAVLAVTPEAEAAVSAVGWDEVRLVLTLKDGEGPLYELVGLAADTPLEGAEMDWFADKPELLYRGEGR